MKKIKQLVMAVLVFVLAFSSLPVVSADTTYTIQLTGTSTGHTYEAHPIFLGDLDPATNTLTNIRWAPGIWDSGKRRFGDAADKAASLSAKGDDSQEAREFAQEISKYLSGGGRKTVSGQNGTTTISGLAPGYYLIKEVNNTLYKKNETYTRFMLQVARDTTVAIKSDVPSLTKATKSSTTGEETTITDYSIGDMVPFQLTATLPRNLDDYSEYELSFNDSLMPGLTYNNDVQVYLKRGDEESLITDHFNISVESSRNLTIATSNLRQVPNVDASSKIVVRYTAQLNQYATTHASANTNMNVASLSFSNNPNTALAKSIGTTLQSKVQIHTYQLNVYKVDERGGALPGAEFTLYKKVNDQYVKVGTTQEYKRSNFSGFKGLGSGDYKLVETITPKGYNTMKDIEFRLRATYDPTLPITRTAIQATSDRATFTYELTNGIFTTKIVNKKGALLPNTGGIGTTILYLSGTGLVLGAGILWMLKKRVNKK